MNLNLSLKATIFTFKLLLAAFYMGPVQAATLIVCNDIAPLTSDTLLTSTTIATQKIQVFLGEDGSRDPGCISQDLAIEKDSLLWTKLVPESPASEENSRVILQGNFEQQRPAVSEVIIPQPQPVAVKQVSTLPYNENILSRFSGKTFGAEGRARLIDNNSLHCEEGNSTAGAVFSTDQLWKNYGKQDLVLQLSGTGRISFGLSDQQRENNESPLILDTFQLDSNSASSSYQVSIPENEGNWISFTLLCAENEAQISISELTLPAKPPITVSYRSAWFWNPSTWQNSPEKLWATAETESINRLYITLPVDLESGEVENQDLAYEFIRRSHERSLEVWAVIGDARDVLPENLGYLLTRVNAYKDFNSTSLDQSAIDGLQLDIEPYLLTGLDLAQDYWRGRYVATISAAHSALDSALPLDLVMPVWWGNHPQWGKLLLDNLNLDAISITVMNYRTTLDRLKDGPTPFFEWGMQHQKSVHVALEAGSLPSETRKNFIASEDEGELWSLKIGPYNILILLSENHKELPGQAFSFAFQTQLDSNNFTFANDLEKLQILSTTLTRTWSVWPSFSGLAIHGLGEIYFENGD